MSTRAQPPWTKPVPKPASPLSLNNSLTRKKEEFIPMDSSRITFYSCGPTVYDHSHMGHARSYITFDIIRRVLLDYFDMQVFFQMNVTDIDDKIILRARKNHLFDLYLNDKSRTDEQKRGDVQQSIMDYEKKCNNEEDVDKKKMMEKVLATARAVGDQVTPDALEKCKTVLVELLDKRDAGSLNLDDWEGSIFQKHASFWEKSFWEDFEALGCMPPDIVTRVSEYVPEVIAFIERIIENGYAYTADGSVYFDTEKFDNSPDHFYAKLMPEKVGDSAMMKESEGDLGMSLIGSKKRPNDFALWKKSKDGEPKWASPWGKGRPGWHIECSAMASSHLGSAMDIHAGGSDLQFPHHDNELAQSEAYHCPGCTPPHQWVNYFLHAGRLDIEGQKMSKSLKNFITIKEALKTYTARQIRLLFMLHQWDKGLDYSSDNMARAVEIEKQILDFFSILNQVFRVQAGVFERGQKWSDEERKLEAIFNEKCKAMHAAVVDNINTPLMLEHLRAMMAVTKKYVSAQTDKLANGLLLRKIGSFVTKRLRVFGLCGDAFGFSSGDAAAGGDVEETVRPFVDCLSNFRDEMRTKALSIKATNPQVAVELLKACDVLRNETFVKLGIAVEDRDGQGSIAKYIGKEAMEQKRQLEELDRSAAEARKEAARLKRKEAEAKKEAQRRIDPKVMFKDLKAYPHFKTFDDEGFPLTDNEGAELSKGMKKKLIKQRDAQAKLFAAYIAESQGEN